MVERLVEALMDKGYLERRAPQTTARICYEMLSGAGLAITEAADAEKKATRDDCADLVLRMLGGLRRDR